MFKKLFLIFLGSLSACNVDSNSNIKSGLDGFSEEKPLVSKVEKCWTTPDKNGIIIVKPTENGGFLVTMPFFVTPKGEKSSIKVKLFLEFLDTQKKLANVKISFGDKTLRHFRSKEMSTSAKYMEWKPTNRIFKNIAYTDEATSTGKRALTFRQTTGELIRVVYSGDTRGSGKLEPLMFSASLPIGSSGNSFFLKVGNDVASCAGFVADNGIEYEGEAAFSEHQGSEDGVEASEGFNQEVVYPL